MIYILIVIMHAGVGTAEFNTLEQCQYVAKTLRQGYVTNAQCFEKGIK
jgi:hypothetical protein